MCRVEVWTWGISLNQNASYDGRQTGQGTHARARPQSIARRRKEMSLSYRVTLQVCEVVSADDKTVHQLDLRDILPEEDMKDLLRQSLEARGFEEGEDRSSRMCTPRRSSARRVSLATWSTSTRGPMRMASTSSSSRSRSDPHSPEQRLVVWLIDPRKKSACRDKQTDALFFVRTTRASPSPRGLVLHGAADDVLGAGATRQVRRRRGFLVERLLGFPAVPLRVVLRVGAVRIVQAL